MKMFVGTKKMKNYRELLAHERGEAERLFIAKVLAREEAKSRRRPARGWAVRPVAIFPNFRDIFLASVRAANASGDAAD